MTNTAIPSYARKPFGALSGRDREKLEAFTAGLEDAALGNHDRGAPASAPRFDSCELLTELGSMEDRYLDLRRSSTRLAWAAVPVLLVACAASFAAGALTFGA